VSNRDPETPILITDAQRSYEEDLATRKRRYGIMMGMRVPCLVVAAMLYNHPFVAAGLILLSVPLPWMAVIIANDVLPKKATAFRRFRDEPEVATAEPLERRAVESGTNPVIDVTEDPAKT
jgi:hypothetical protein